MAAPSACLPFNDILGTSGADKSSHLKANFRFLSLERLLNATHQTPNRIQRGSAQSPYATYVFRAAWAQKGGQRSFSADTSWLDVMGGRQHLNCHDSALFLAVPQVSLESLVDCAELLGTQKQIRGGQNFGVFHEVRQTCTAHGACRTTRAAVDPSK